MTNSQNFQIGNAVLADYNGAQIPGVVEDVQNGKAYVRLAEPWVDETGQKSDTVWIPTDRLSLYIDEETGSKEALPG